MHVYANELLNSRICDAASHPAEIVSEVKHHGRLTLLTCSDFVFSIIFPRPRPQRGGYAVEWLHSLSDLIVFSDASCCRYCDYTQCFILKRFLCLTSCSTRSARCSLTSQPLSKTDSRVFSGAARCGGVPVPARLWRPCRGGVLDMDVTRGIWGCAH